jgi:amino-acid N-acetyltransferase
VSRTDPPRVNAIPLADWERDGVVAALKGAGVPDEEVCAPGAHFWRYESLDMTPVGFGGLEIHDRDALMHAVVTMPPLRGRGFARAIVAALETEALNVGCRAMWLLKTAEAETKMFDRMGYRRCDPADVPPAIRKAPLFASLTAAGAKIMSKSFE